MNDDELLHRMVEIRSVSGEEATLAQFLVDELPRRGFWTRTDAVGNVVARRGDPDDPMILLVGHLDTVPGGPPVRRKGRVLHGRGTVDAKGPLAAMICAAQRAATDGVQVVVAGVVEEETFGKGATHLAGSLRPDALVVGEPNKWDGIGIGYKGRVMLRCTLTRPPAHTASPQEKAGEAAVTFWNAVVAHCAGLTTSERAFEQAVPTLIDLNATLEHATLTLSVRTPPGFDLPAFERMVQAAAGDDELVIEDRTPAVRIPTDGLVVRALRTAVRARGARPRLTVKTGTADLNILEPVWRVPAAVYGPGDSALDHTDHEHLDLDEFARSVDVLHDAIGLIAEELRADAPRQEADS